MHLEDVGRNYDSAAAYYDAVTNLVYHRLLRLYRWRRRLIARLELSAGETVLDFGCGTGNNFRLIEEAIDPGGRIIGVDYSCGMPERARDRYRRAGWSNVTLLQDDAARLEQFGDQADATVSAWCLGIVHDLLRARWESGRQYLRDHLEEMREERYLWDMGSLVNGSNRA